MGSSHDASSILAQNGRENPVIRVCFDEHGEEIRRYEQEQAARLELEEQLRLEQQSLRAAEERARELERKLRQLEENRTGDA
jgi:hypothetical protein